MAADSPIPYPMVCGSFPSSLRSSGRPASCQMSNRNPTRQPGHHTSVHLVPKACPMAGYGGGQQFCRMWILYPMGNTPRSAQARTSWSTHNIPCPRPRTNYLFGFARLLFFPCHKQLPLITSRVRDSGRRDATEGERSRDARRPRPGGRMLVATCVRAAPPQLSVLKASMIDT